MSQANIEIQDGTGLEVLLRMNNALAAIASDFSGAQEPSPTWPLMKWASLGDGVLKIRNLANDGWIEFMDLATGEVLAGVIPGDIARKAEVDAVARTVDVLESQNENTVHISGLVGGTNDISIEASDISFRQGVYIPVAPYQKLVLSRVYYAVRAPQDDTRVRLRITARDNEWVASRERGCETPGKVMWTSEASRTLFEEIVVTLVNTSTFPETVSKATGWWIEVKTID